MNQPDFTDRNGALRLRAQLISYWALRCGDLEQPAVNIVTPYASPYAESHKMERARYDLRSDMVNGTPRGFVWRWNGRKWGLVRNETHERSAAPALVGSIDASRARSLPESARSGAEGQPVLRNKTPSIRKAKLSLFPASV